MHGLKPFLSSNVASQSKRQRDRTLTLLTYGLYLSIVAITAANAAEKITNFKDQRESQIGTVIGCCFKALTFPPEMCTIHKKLLSI